MTLSGRAAVFGSSLSGAAVGIAFGLPYGWIATQLALIGVLSLLQSNSAQPSRAAGLAAVFSFSVFATGFAGFVAGAPQVLQAVALLPWFGWSALLAAAVCAVAALACRLRVPNTVRWGVVWPAGWMAMEWMASLGANGMPWLRLGQQQAPNGIFAGWLPVGGTLLAGFVMWLLAAVALAAWHNRQRANAHLSVIGLLLAASLLLRAFEWTDAAEPVHAALVQPGDKRPAESGAAAAAELMTYYRDAALDSSAQLIVTPQLALPKSADAVPARYWSELHHSLARRGADLLMGVYVASDSDGLYNAALALGASGRQRYLKHQLFPLGETLPLSGAPRRWMDQLTGTPMQDALRGPRPSAPLLLAGRPVALSICFEAAFASLWREQAATASVLVNMSSDSALASAQVARQFRQHLQARALEFGKPVLRSSDVDGTYAIDHRGQDKGSLERLERGVLHVTVQSRRGLTPFARFGDALAALAALLLLLAALHSRMQTQRSAEPLSIARGQTGQVMLPAVALLAISGGLLYLMINSSQAVNEKTRITNAADAAAYSAGVVEARALNFYAYTNRAMVANQIVIAQAISVGSWMRYFGQAAQNITGESVNLGVMFGGDFSQEALEGLRAGAAFAAAEYAMQYYTSYTPMDVADWVLHTYAVIAGIVATHDAVTQALSLDQSLVRANLFGGLRQRELADDLVRAMDPALSAEIVPVTHGFDLFAERYTGEDRARFADVTMRSRDEFTRERNWTRESRDILPVRRNGALRKRGGTDLAGLDEWRAVDTLELHGQRFGCGRFGLSWCDDIRRPIGWAGVNVNNGSGDQGAAYHGNAYRANPTTAERADEDMEEPTYGDSGPSAYYSGIPAAMELARLEPDADRTTGVTVMVTKRHADLLTSGGAAQARPSGELALFNDRPAGARMVALSRAQVFFDRIEPRSASGAGSQRDEIGSLYNPYWRVRLVAPTVLDQAYAAERQEGLTLP
jgi:apolipoprotein N-acyltransferase